MKTMIAAAALLALAGCAGLGEGVDTAIDSAKALEDAKAKAAVNAQCAAGVGALQRSFTAEVQEYVWKACGALNSSSAADIEPAEDQ